MHIHVLWMDNTLPSYVTLSARFGFSLGVERKKRTEGGEYSYSPVMLSAWSEKHPMGLPICQHWSPVTSKRRTEFPYMYKQWKSCMPWVIYVSGHDSKDCFRAWSPVPRLRMCSTPAWNSLYHFPVQGQLSTGAFKKLKYNQYLITTKGPSSPSAENPTPQMDFLFY